MIRRVFRITCCMFVIVVVAASFERGHAAEVEVRRSILVIVKRDGAEVRVEPGARSQLVRRCRAAECVEFVEEKNGWRRIHDGWLAAQDVISKEDAVEYFSAAIKTGPTSLSYACRARAYLLLKRADEALADAERAVAIEPGYAPGWYILGSVRRIRGDAMNAEVAYREALRLAPDFGAVHGVLGVLMACARRYEEAIAELTKAVENGDGDGQTFCARGCSHLFLGQPRRAIEDFTRAIALCPDEEKLYTNRALAYRWIGSLQAALADANRAIELNESFAFAFEIRGSVRGKMGEDNDALRDFAQAIELNPKPVHTLVSRATLHCNAGRLEDARADAERALRIDPNDSGAIAMRGLVLLHTGDFALAVRYLRKSVSLNPDEAETHSALGEALNALGDYPAAARELAEATRRNAFSVSAHCCRAKLLSQCPDPAIRDGREALACAKRACELTKYRDAESLRYLAAAYAELSDFPSALRYLNDAVRFASPDDDDFHQRAAREREFYEHDRAWRYQPPAPRNG